MVFPLCKVISPMPTKKITTVIADFEVVKSLTNDLYGTIG